MLLLIEFLLGAIQFMAGAALFSFLNAAAYRLPRGMKLVNDHSACPQCGARLTAPDLIPVVSWLALRGRCRHCGAKIPVRYLLMELTGGGLALLCIARFGASSAGLFGFSAPALLSLCFLGILTAIALIDGETQTIPDRLNLAVAVCGVLALFFMPGVTPAARLIGAACVSVPMFLLCLAVPGGFGGGDIKLMAAAGLFLGWKLTLLSAFLAILGGGAYGAYLLAAKKKARRDHFAFGPFLCAGMVVALFLGEPILGWYLQFFA